ncbi:hypothetical protein RSK20926_11819 [Roseobacter sp. SK209-2-6]|nr:hypothetical protein RSK20926_11819 [Roseobacter sp. SK209-2-6]
MLQAMHAQQTDEVILPLITLTQVGWEDELRFVPNTQPIQHNGDEFRPLAFDVGLPDEEAEGVPVINWVADNTDRRMVEALRQVRGTVQAHLVWIMASDPDVIQLGPMEVEMRAAEYDARAVRGTMGVEPILEQSFGQRVMNPANTPALF